VLAHEAELLAQHGANLGQRIQRFGREDHQGTPSDRRGEV
jgi:hypothetical protein